MAIVRRESRKPDVTFRFRKEKDNPDVCVWLSVSIRKTKKVLDQKGRFWISNVWNREVVSKLEERWAAFLNAHQAVEESARDVPSTPSVEELKALQRDGYWGRVVEATKPYEAWAEKHQHLRESLDREDLELKKLYDELLRQRPDIPEKLLSYVVPLEGNIADENYYCLYRSSIWSSKQALVPDQWRVLIENSLAHEDAKLKAALKPLGNSPPDPSRPTKPYLVKNSRDNMALDLQED